MNLVDRGGLFPRFWNLLYTLSSLFCFIHKIDKIRVCLAAGTCSQVPVCVGTYSNPILPPQTKMPNFEQNWHQFERNLAPGFSNHLLTWVNFLFWNSNENKLFKLHPCCSTRHLWIDFSKMVKSLFFFTMGLLIVV